MVFDRWIDGSILWRASFCLFLFSATDLRNIVGSDLEQSEIDEIFKQFDINGDGEIDFA